MNNARLRYYRLWLTLGWGLVGLVVYLSLAALPKDLAMPFPYADKVSHLLTYMLLAGWFGQIEKRWAKRLLYAAFFILMGVALEYLQGLGGVRHRETADMLANATGVGIGLLLSTTLLRGVLAAIDRRLAKGRS